MSAQPASFGAAAQLSLDARYRAESGTILITGMQALLRVLLDQVRVDRRAGRRTAGFISGYPGSPLGGVDLELQRHEQVFLEGGVHHQLGLNEELAATAVYGTQLLHEVPGARYDGVFGVWFGKAPGLDRAADAIHHANFHGVARNGGVLAVAGDDPHPRSTILPTDSNTILTSFYMPVLAPGSVQEVLDYGLHGIALSRAAGLWVGFKLVSDVADSFGTVDIRLESFRPVLPQVQFDGQAHVPQFRANEAGGPMNEREREIVYGRLEIARQYGRLNGLNRIVVNPTAAHRGILVGGKTYYDLREALHQMGLEEPALHDAGIRILKLGLLYPFDQDIAREFAEGLQEILVIEDKRPFLEIFLKDALYGTPHCPRVIGKRDSRGETLMTACGELSSDLIQLALARWLDRPSAPAPMARSPEPLAESRTPYFCSGCPHNRSLKVPEGAIVGAGIGCHIMTLWMGRVFGEVVGYTQMGGEGAQWVGLHRFTNTRHIFQNIGDGTLAHSGSLAIRFAIAARVNITYKILYNSAVAMTGGQPVFGGASVEDLVRQLAAEGVRRIVITTDQPERYRHVRFDPSVRVCHRDELLAAERELAATEGVTVLLYDQQCAAEKRRLRKRGLLERPAARVLINERVCEGCGDCGLKSNCLSVEPVETEFGRKTRINQSSCNQDYSCILGDCPSFMTVSGDRDRRVTEAREPAVTLAEPTPIVPEGEFAVFMAGIGGTGVITVNQILGVAAGLAGRHVRAIDQIGSSQKAGPVTSHLHVSTVRRDGAARVMAGDADLFLAFDLLCAAEGANLGVCGAERTVLVACTDAVPTGGTVTDIARVHPGTATLCSRLEAVTRPDPVYVEALALARQLFGSEAAANILLVGAAYQAGALPLPLACIEAAIRLNGVAIENNLRAFRWGRYVVQAPALVADCLRGAADRPVVVTLDPALDRLVKNLGLSSAFAARVRLRSAELVRYQDEAYARAYLSFLERIRAAERSQELTSEVTEGVALGLYKLMAYKDEYEVARLLVADYEARRVAGALNGKTKIHWHLQPSFARTLGVRRKLRVGKWFLPVARGLAALKVIRGSALDLFARTRVRREERRLITDYRQDLLRAATHLNSENAATVAALARLPDVVRGYEDVKIESIRRYEERRVALLRDIEKRTTPVLAPG